LENLVNKEKHQGDFPAAPAAAREQIAAAAVVRIFASP
jgi:hypothetical protein